MLTNYISPYTKTNKSVYLPSVFVFISLSLMNSPFALAENETKINGFISQGIIYTSENKINGDSDSGSFKLTELGLNMSKRFTPRVRLSGQAISRIVDQESDGDITLDYLFIDYKVPINSSIQLGGRAGRIKNVIGFYNETRDVAFTRPSISAPESIYFDFVRDLQLSSDGVAGYAEWRSISGTLLLELGSGKARINSETEVSLISETVNGKFYKEDIEQARLSYALSDQSWRFALSKITADLKYKTEPLSFFGAGEIPVDLRVLSVEYASELFVLTSEYMLLDIDYVQPPLPARIQPISSWFIQGQYHHNSNWSIYSRHEQLYFNKNDRDGSQFSQVTGLPAHSAFSSSWLVGVKWQPSYNWMLLAEIRNIEGTAELSRDNNPNPFETKKYWQAVSVMLSYRF